LLQVHKLCKYYGPLLGYVGEEAMHDFPTPSSLTGSGVESHLRELGFGYRARYIAETARKVALEKPADWLESLRNPEQPSFNPVPVPNRDHATYKGAHDELLSLSGVGPKVADCVCLMGLGWGESVPVDTHVWQIAQRDYKFGKVKTKTFNKVMYDSVGDHFRGLWGKYAGWAHSVLFTADLRDFADRTPKKEVVKVEVKEEPASPSSGRGARKRKVVTEIKTETSVKVEETEKGPVFEVQTRTKRRRTRASA
jgi:N-glycosylase/DNA lyase